MNRRKLMLGVAATALAGKASAGIGCYAGPQYNQRTCNAGVPIGNMPTPWQECKVWCWAACAQTAFMLAGHSVHQSNFAEKIFGDTTVCEAATGPMIKKAIDGRWTYSDGRSFTSKLNVIMDHDYGLYHNNPMAVVWQELQAGRPLLTGSLGHATLITAINYTETQGYMPITNSITVRDPWPASPNKRYMSPNEIGGVKLLATFSFSKLS